MSAISGTAIAFAVGGAATAGGAAYSAHKQASSADKAANRQQTSNAAALDWEKEVDRREQGQYLEERERKWKQEDVDRKLAEEDRLRKIGWDEEELAFAREKWAAQLGISEAELGLSRERLAAEKEKFAKEMEWKEEDRRLAAIDKERQLRQLKPYVEFGENKLATLDSLLRPGAQDVVNIKHAAPPPWAGQRDLAQMATPPPQQMPQLQPMPPPPPPGDLRNDLILNGVRR